MAGIALKEEIAEYVEKLVLEEEMEYLSAILDAMDQFHLDYSQIAHNLSPALKSKLENELAEQGLIRGASKPMVTF